MTKMGLVHTERVAMARLKALLELLPASLDKQMAQVGLTSFEFTLLEALDEADDHRLRLSALASRTNATLPRLSRVVTGLENKGLVIRTACSDDGRATNAVLTLAGVARQAEAKPVYEEAVRTLVIADLNEADVADLSRLAYLILARLDPDRRLAATAEDVAVCAADVASCPADAAVRPADGAVSPSDAAASAASVSPFASAGSSDCPADPTER